MPSPVKTYQAEMHDNLGFFATWLPGDHIELGELGVLVDGRFRKLSSLKDVGIDFEPSAASAPQTVQYTSTSGTKIVLGAGVGSVVPGTKAEIQIEFSKQGAFVFHAHALRHVRIENRAAVASAILKAHERGKWDKRWYLIESVHLAEKATIIVAQDSSAALTLQASADVPIGTTPLADPSVELTVSSTRGRVLQVIGGRDLRPMYLCAKLRKRWLNPEFGPVRGAADVSPAEFELGRPDVDVLLES